jgi:antitoxin (DNA-binding transcriptional repressor) of toxin-antitoxin stability system
MAHMKTVTVRDVQHNFGAILALLEHEEEIVVTRRNRAVARIVPAHVAQAPDWSVLRNLHRNIFSQGPVSQASIDDIMRDQRGEP